MSDKELSRSEIAALVLNGILANNDLVTRCEALSKPGEKTAEPAIARCAVSLADALITALKKEKEK